MANTTIENIVLNNLLHLFGESPSGSVSSKFMALMSRRKKRRNALLSALHRDGSGCALGSEQSQGTVAQVEQSGLESKNISQLSDEEFSSHFCMLPQTFKKILAMLRPLWKASKTGRPGVTLEKSLYITLYKIGTFESFRDVSQRFEIGRSTCYRAFNKIVKLLAQLRTNVIQFPADEQCQRTMINEFRDSQELAFPHVLGCVDVMHVCITQPPVDADYFHNRRGNYSVAVQAIADAKLKFIDAFVGYPGHFDDATVWRRSSMRNAIANKTVRFPEECYLLGDSTYPLEPYLMIPYEDDGTLSPEQVQFNTVLNSHRECIIQAFGLLKKKFAILQYVENQNLQLIKELIMACLVLYNIIIDSEGVPKTGLAAVEEESNAPCIPIFSQLYPQNVEAEAKRNRLAATIASTAAKT